MDIRFSYQPSLHRLHGLNTGMPEKQLSINPFHTAPDTAIIRYRGEQKNLSQESAVNLPEAKIQEIKRLVSKQELPELKAFINTNRQPGIIGRLFAEIVDDSDYTDAMILELLKATVKKKKDAARINDQDLRIKSYRTPLMSLLTSVHIAPVATILTFPKVLEALNPSLKDRRDNPSDLLNYAEVVLRSLKRQELDYNSSPSERTAKLHLALLKDISDPTTELGQLISENTHRQSLYIEQLAQAKVFQPVDVDPRKPFNVPYFLMKQVAETNASDEKIRQDLIQKLKAMHNTGPDSFFILETGGAKFFQECLDTIQKTALLEKVIIPAIQSKM